LKTTGKTKTQLTNNSKRKKPFRPEKTFSYEYSPKDRQTPFVFSFIEHKVLDFPIIRSVSFSEYFFPLGNNQPLVFFLRVRWDNGGCLYCVVCFLFPEFPAVVMFQLWRFPNWLVTM